MLNLNEIEKDCREIQDTYAMAARAHIWLPALVAELREARAEIERLRAPVPPDDEYYSYAELPQAWRIEEAQE